MLLEVSGLTKSFGQKPIISDISFTCKTAEILGVFGKNGSGKSTLLKTIYGTLNANSINISIDGKSISPKNIIPSKLISYLPQGSFLPKELKVRHAIPLFYKGDKQDKIFYAPRVSSFENKKTGQLSMGELRYLETLLIAHLGHPFLLLDEPFSMVEPLFKELIKELFLELKSKKGIIVTDHYYRDVLEITDRNFLLRESKKIDINNTSDLTTNGYLNSEDS